MRDCVHQHASTGRYCLTKLGGEVHYFEVCTCGHQRSMVDGVADSRDWFAPLVEVSPAELAHWRDRWA